MHPRAGFRQLRLPPWITTPGVIALVGLTSPVAQAKSTLVNTMRQHITNSTILKDAEVDPDKVVGLLISSLLGVLGVLFFILIIYGGYLWMTAHGVEEKIAKAKKIILSASVGLAIVMGSYLITTLILEVLVTQTTKPPT